jgi:hypothetical protein
MPTTSEPRALSPAGVRRRGSTWLGLGATGRTAVAPRGVFGGELHVEREGISLPSLRISAHLAAGSQATERATIAVSLWAGQLELCPLRVGGPSVMAFSCAGMELGALRVVGDGPGGVADVGPWVAASVIERLRWRVGRYLGFEAAVGLTAPLTRLEILAEHPRQLLHRVDPVGLMAVVGVSWRLP